MERTQNRPVRTKADDGRTGIFLFSSPPLDEFTPRDFERFVELCAASQDYTVRPTVYFQHPGGRININNHTALAGAMALISEGTDSEPVFAVQPPAATTNPVPGGRDSRSLRLKQHVPAATSLIQPRSVDAAMQLQFTTQHRCGVNVSKLGRRDVDDGLTFVVRRASPLGHPGEGDICQLCLIDGDARVPATLRCHQCDMTLCSPCDLHRHRFDDSHRRDSLAAKADNATFIAELLSEDSLRSPTPETPAVNARGCQNCLIEATGTTCGRCGEPTDVFPVMLLYPEEVDATDWIIGQASIMAHARSARAAAAVMPSQTPSKASDMDWKHSAATKLVSHVIGLTVPRAPLKKMYQDTEKGGILATLSYTKSVLSEVSFKLQKTIADKQAVVDTTHGPSCHTLLGNGYFVCGRCDGHFKCSKAVPATPSSKKAKRDEGDSASTMKVTWDLNAVKVHASKCTGLPRRGASANAANDAATSLLASSTVASSAVFTRQPLWGSDFDEVCSIQAKEISEGARVLVNDRKVEVAPGQFVAATRLVNLPGMERYMSKNFQPLLTNVTPTSWYLYHERQEFLRSPASYRPPHLTEDEEFSLSANDIEHRTFWPGYSFYMKASFDDLLEQGAEANL